MYAWMDVHVYMYMYGRMDGYMLQCNLFIAVIIHGPKIFGLIRQVAGINFLQADRSVMMVAA